MRFMSVPLTQSEQDHLDTIKMWLDCLRDWFGLMLSDDEYGIVIDANTPPWVTKCASRLKETLWAPVGKALPEPLAFTPYQVGYAAGLMRWGTQKVLIPTPPEVKAAVKRIRLSKGARREAIKIWNDFLISMKILERRAGKLRLTFSKELRHFARVVGKYTGEDEVEFLKGLADGRQGVGPNAPGDMSTDATDLYLMLVMYWRWVVRLPSVSELHVWLVRRLGEKRVGEKKRVEKICQRIGLRLARRGRPALTVNPTLALPG